MIGVRQAVGASGISIGAGVRGNSGTFHTYLFVGAGHRACLFVDAGHREQRSEHQRAQRADGGDDGGEALRAIARR
eukprot:SAG11_NODE_37577_length_256_cov_0.662420_1_plen_75_part_01